MSRAVLDVINYINSAVDKTEEIKDLPPEMSSKVLDNRIMALEGYIRYIERETIPKLQNLTALLEGAENG